jgi:putative adenylate-forming enzyme
MSTNTAVQSHGADMNTLRALGAELIARDRWPRERLLGLQREQLTELVSHAIASSPYYRETLGRDAVGIPLDQLPTLPKTTLVDQFDRILTDPRLRLADLEAHLGGPDAATPYLGEYRVFATSGTSGLRGLVVYSEQEFTYWVAVSLRLFARIGITSDTRLVAIGAPEPLHITRQLFAAFRSGRRGTPELSVLTPIDEMVGALNTYRPEAIVTYASIAALLAQEQLEGRLRIEPRIVAVGAEVLTDESRVGILDAWGVHATNIYATTENLYVASSTPPLPDLRIHEDLAVIEVVDERNQPVPPGTRGFKVLVTNLVNRTQPLIRYEISDSVLLAENPDPAGLPFRRIARVDGRSDDVVRLPGVGGGEVAVHPYRLRSPFSALGAVRQYQIVHDETGLHIRIVLQPAAPPNMPEKVRAAMLDALQDAGVLAPPLDVTEVDVIEREPGHAAKLKLVKTRGPGHATVTHRQ